jgi:hypothetical protein
MQQVEQMPAVRVSQRFEDFVDGSHLVNNGG